jgi:endonuclease/exonuclease/phosphatase family metal-dependent hydrolase
MVMGDLNEGLDGPAVTALASATGLRNAVPASAGGSNHEFTGRTDGRRLDHLLVPPTWAVRAAAVDHRPVDGRLASDHWPVVADVVPDAG